MIPVTVLTGFLGAGKTTLLNRILTEQHGRKIAVIENEFGEVGVDHQLVIREKEEIFEMNNGCICCTVRGDLIRILQRLAQRGEPIEAVLIETTGLADPGPVAQTFFTNPEIHARYRLDGIVTLVDTRHIGQHWNDSDEAKKQIAFADVVLLNKTDLVTASELDAIEQRIQRMNPVARVHRTQQATIALDHVLDVGGFNLSRAYDLDPRFLEPEYPFEWGGVYQLTPGRYELVLFEGPDPEMEVVLIDLPSTTTEDIDAARDAAVLSFSDEDAPALAAGDVLAPSSSLRRLTLTSFPAVFPIEIAQAGHYAFFTQHHPLEFSAALRNANGACSTVWAHEFKPDHEHDEAVSSVGFALPGEMDEKRLNDWLAELLRTQGTDIFRSKGVLAVRGQERRLVFQGVHMMFDGRYDRPWGNDPRTSNLVFIGRNLERAALEAGFQACLAE